MKDARLRDDPPATKPFPLPAPAEYTALDHRHSVNDAEVGVALAALREAAGDAFLVGEVYLQAAHLAPYLEHLDMAFAFELLHAPFDAGRLREVIRGRAAPRSESPGCCRTTTSRASRPGGGEPAPRSSRCSC